MVALLLLSELGDDRRKWADHLFQQYRSALASSAERLALTDDTPIVFEFDEEALVFTFATLRACCERFIVQVAFNLDPMHYNDTRASFRLNGLRSDGTRSWGASCPLRRERSSENAPDAA
jgi:hypothetical protein